MTERNPFGGGDRGAGEADDASFKINDRRHWARGEEPEEPAGADAPPAIEPSVVGELRQRAEAAEAKLLEYVTAFRKAQSEQEQLRERLTRDVERRVELGFAGLVADLLESLDDLDLALAHASDRPEVAPLAKGVALARDRFVAALRKAGVERLDLDGTAFDPNVAEALRLVPVDAPEQDGTVVETMRPAYRLGDRILRPARVAVGRHGG